MGNGNGNGNGDGNGDGNGNGNGNVFLPSVCQSNCLVTPLLYQYIVPQNFKCGQHRFMRGGWQDGLLYVAHPTLSFTALEMPT